MSYISTVLLVVAFSSNPADAIDKRIVNGTTAADGQYPYQASLRSNNRHVCGGSILNNRWVLTSAVCLTEGYQLVVVVGTNTLNAGGDTYLVATYNLHPLYKIADRRYNAGLINTTTPIIYSSKVKPVVLTTLLPIDGAVAVVTGWGYRDDYGQLSRNDLIALNTTVISQTACQSQLKRNVSSTHICTFWSQTGPCIYDDGTPITICGMQFGIVSVRNCGINPDLHTKISSVYSWIVSMI
ncbi:hypothetical protein RN001_015129 [Aquatica leii]|uniref:Peptidase S1 domain-containing protein n=1 Tax=Aquatica leii TaxID=1421715 RepID=A0AAN7NVA3_9COLE|nr:hypothetical protein RN001_015129 [Aquatica leii]